MYKRTTSIILSLVMFLWGSILLYISHSNQEDAIIYFEKVAEEVQQIDSTLAISQTKPQVTEPSETIAQEIIPEETKPSEPQAPYVCPTQSETFKYQNLQFVVPHVCMNRTPQVAQNGYTEQFTEVPQHFQSLYNIRYGGGTVRESGCGLVSAAMVMTYLLDEELSIEQLAKNYGRFNSNGHGSDQNLFPTMAEDYGITGVIKSHNWKDALNALKNNQVVIACVKAPSLFTSSGHYIVLSGLTSEGKIIVKDPNMYNFSIWTYPKLKEGFLNGFDEESIKYCAIRYAIYPQKDIEKVAELAKSKTITYKELANTEFN